jgi:6-phosphogluconolactonase
MPQIYLSNDAMDLAAQACGWLAETIEQHQSGSSSPFALALAGGSTPRALYQLLVKPQQHQIDWTRVLIVWGDERNVPTDHVDSNYRMAMDSLIDSIPVPASNVIGVPNPGGDARAAAVAYEKLLRDRLPTDANGLGVIDCVLLGMGDDVHTASLFPETAALGESKAWVAANFVPKLNAWRVTFTAPLINAAKQVAFLIAGPSKTQALQTLWHGPQAPQLYPSQIINPSSGALTFFVDRSALGNVAIPSNFRIVQ